MLKTRRLFIDIETYGSVDLAASGVYKYAESEGFQVLLFAYSFDDGPVSVVDLAHGETLPSIVSGALNDVNVEKWAFNASFERICLSRMLGMRSGVYLPPESWRCCMVLSAAFGMPMSLAAVGEALEIEQPKLTEGKRLIRKFSVPAQIGAPRLPGADQDDWDKFKAYNKRDVESEREIFTALNKYGMPKDLWSEYAIDQRINDLGVAIDVELARRAVEMDERSRAELTKRMSNLTGLENPNSAAQLKDWLADQGVETDSIGKKIVETLHAESDDEELREVLGLRLQLAKSSVKKYQAMLNCVCRDGRVRGMFQFYGARTARWAGRRIQMQNLPSGSIPDLEEARELVKSGDYEAVRLLYENVPETLSRLLRTAFIAHAGTRFIVADYSAIEARVIAWLAGESWRLDVFRNGGDIYCASASRMFKVRVEKHGINGHLRQKGKVAELGLGFGGGVSALKAMGAVDMGIPVSELQDIVTKWREASPRIVALWWSIDRAVKTAVRTGKRQTVGRVYTERRGDYLFIGLPSGRELAYYKPGLGTNRYGGESVTFMGLTQERRWTRSESYGPKFVENIVQATARDLLMNAMSHLRSLRIVMHVHDELVIEAGPELSRLEICNAMANAPAWADGLPLAAEGFETLFYRKD